MFADWVEMTSSTGGTSTLTCSTVTGAPSAMSVWGSSGTQWISYCIEEWSSSARTGPPILAESGVGNIALSTGVLTRTKKVATWNASTTTYTNVNPSAISFGTTSANIRILIAPVAEMATNILPFYCSSSPADAIGLASAHAPIQSNTFTMSNNREHYTPFLWTGCGDISTIGIACTTSAASSGVKCGLYDVGSDGFPGNLIQNWNSTALATTSTGIKTTTVTSFYLPPGWYYAGMISNSSSVALRAHQAGSLASPAGSASTGQPISQYRRTGGTYSSGMPSPAPSAASLTATTATACAILFLTPRNT